MSQTPVPLLPWCKRLPILPIGCLNAFGAQEWVRRLGRHIRSHREIQSVRELENSIGVGHCVIGIADLSRRSYKGAMAWATGLSAQGLYEGAPLASYISIKTQEEWIENAQGVMSLLVRRQELALNGRCFSDLWSWMLRGEPRVDEASLKDARHRV